MRIKLLFLFLLVLGFNASAQRDSVQTIVISKGGAKLFRGTEAKTESWYFYIDEEGYSYMANLELPEEEIAEWFEKRKNSDNIFRSDRQTVDELDIVLRKNNEPDVILHFQVFIEQNKLLIVNLEDQDKYNFAKINIQE